MVLSPTEEKETSPAAISLGQIEIDDKMGGGLPPGSLTLIEGQSGAGKSVLAQQLICSSLNSQYNVKLFTTENTVKSLIKQMDSLNLDITDYFLLSKLKIHPLKVERDQRDTKDLLKLLFRAIQRERHYSLVVLDAITCFVNYDNVDGSVITFFEDCRSLCDEGMTIISVIHSHAQDTNTMMRLRSACDCNLRLRIEQMGDQLVKMLEVSKVRGAQKNTGNIISFDIEPKWGIRIIPASKAKA